MPDEPKIIIDDDWKKQARAEKAKLAEADKAAQERAAAAKAAATAPLPGMTSAPAPVGGPADAQPDDPNAPYKVDFNELLRMFGTQALMYLGQFPDPQTGKAIIALDVAKVQIDLLGVIEEKTKGNLTPQEEADLKGLLGELRMIFVEISRGVAKAMQEGRIGPRGEVRPPAGPMGGPPGAGPGAML